jgi:hypothetical protein
MVVIGGAHSHTLKGLCGGRRYCEVRSTSLIHLGGLGGAVSPPQWGSDLEAKGSLKYAETIVDK